MTVEFLVDGPADAETSLVLAHGAGAPMDSPFLAHMAQGVAAKGHRVVRFEFAYMAERRRDGRRRAPSRLPALLAEWQAVVDDLGGPTRLVIGGKSMGGRIASILATEAPVAGLVCLGYPFHPPGKPSTLRTDHLGSIACRSLIVQGTRDPFGNKEEVTGYQLTDGIDVHWIEDGDHDLKPRKSSGISVETAWRSAVDAVDTYLGTLQ